MIHFSDHTSPSAGEIFDTAKLSSASKAVALAAAFEGGRKLYNTGRGTWRENFAYTVTIMEDDLLYNEVHDWLLEITPEEKHRALLVSSGAGYYEDQAPTAGGGVEPVKALRIKFNDSESRKVMIDGHTVTVTLRKPEDVNEMRRPKPKSIEFLTRTYAAQKAILAHLHRLNETRTTSRKAVLKMVGTWGDWRTRSDLPPRTLDSVSMPAEQKNKIVNDMAEFLEDEAKYNSLSIPWHRGYMFHGPPGTGKTSLAKALSNHFNLDLWYVSLSDLKQESSLLQLLSEVGPRSILLLEDIDTAKITNDRDGADSGTISMGSLLNALDGVATPHGMITIMTTNRFEILDPALTRAGRMDVIEEITYPSVRTLADLYNHFYSQSLLEGSDFDILDDTPLLGLSTAQVAETFKRNMRNPTQARKDLMRMMSQAMSLP